MGFFQQPQEFIDCLFFASGLLLVFRFNATPRSTGINKDIRQARVATDHTSPSHLNQSPPIMFSLPIVPVLFFSFFKLLALSVAPEIPPRLQTNPEMWEQAVLKYQVAHQLAGVPFQRHNYELANFANIPGLGDEALRLGRERGVLFVGRPRARLPSEQKTYFSTVIRPEDLLGQDMQLDHKVALAFWKKDINGPQLIEIDVLTDHHIQWPLTPYDRVVGHH